MSSLLHERVRCSVFGGYLTRGRECVVMTGDCHGCAVVPRVNRPHDPPSVPTARIGGLPAQGVPPAGGCAPSLTGLKFEVKITGIFPYNMYIINIFCSLFFLPTMGVSLSLTKHLQFEIEGLTIKHIRLYFHLRLFS